MSDVITLDDLRAARSRIAGPLHRTPTVTATTLGRRAGVRLWLKAELLQKTGSFKPRGVLNKLRSLSDAERACGLVSLSAGNHAQALAWGAGQIGARAVVVMPATAVSSKVDATRGYGGEVVLTERPLMDVVHELQAERGLTMVHPFDDPLVIAGQGTVGLEILEDVPDVELVVVPIGGGGLISGIAAAVKHSGSEARVIGVEPEGSDVMFRSLMEGRPARLARSNTIADGLAAPFAGQHTYVHVRRFVDDVVRVTDEHIAEAMRLLVERAKLVAEPAGAAALAALLSGAAKAAPDAATVCVVSGGNVGAAVLKNVLEGWG